MNESKFKRLVAAATATAVVLLVLLLAVMIFQLASINNERAKQREYEAAIALYEQMIADGELASVQQARDVIRDSFEIKIYEP